MCRIIIVVLLCERISYRILPARLRVPRGNSTVIKTREHVIFKLSREFLKTAMIFNFFQFARVRSRARVTPLAPLVFFLSSLWFWVRRLACVYSLRVRM